MTPAQRELLAAAEAMVWALPAPTTVGIANAQRRLQLAIADAKADPDALVAALAASVHREEMKGRNDNG